MTTAAAQQRVEALGPAERIIQALTSHVDHLYHGRPGLVSSAPGTPTGASWVPVAWKEERDAEGLLIKTVYGLQKSGKRTQRTRLGVLGANDVVVGNGRALGRYMAPGLFEEIAAYLYRQVAEVYKLDNEFAAKWASWAFAREHRDLKLVLAAFMLCQERKGELVGLNHDKMARVPGDEVIVDVDYRDVGEAMCLIYGKNAFDAKMLLRLGDFLELPRVAEINRELGFGNSSRSPFMGRYPKVVEKWLRHRENNPKLLEGLVKAGFRTTVKRLAQRVGYKPESQRFFEILRWRQKQAKDGRREIAIGAEMAMRMSFASLSEVEVCNQIATHRPNWKWLVGALGAGQMTRAIVACAVESGCMSDADLVILTPTLEELGLLTDHAPTKAKWEAACKKAESTRAANVAKNVRSEQAKEGLQKAVDTATAKAMEEATRGLRVYVLVDISGSMSSALTEAKRLLTKFVGGIPLSRLHVAVFNSAGREVTIAGNTAAHVEQAFRGFAAGGGTSHAAGVMALTKYKPQADEDALFVFVGDEGELYVNAHLQTALEGAGIKPVAFAMLRVPGETGNIIHRTAQSMSVPMLDIDPAMFDDPAGVTRTLKRLIQAAPVPTERAMSPWMPRRESLVEQILKVDLLRKPIFC